MRTDEHFWWATMVRGLFALLVSSAVLILPGMTRTVLLLPIAVVISILLLAAYGLFDSVLVFMTSYMAVTKDAKIALRLQGLVGVLVGALLYVVFFDHVQLHWFLALIAIQAFSTGIGEFVAARHSMTKSTSHWNMAAAIVALIFACVYLIVLLEFAETMTPEQISLLVFGYLAAFGIAQCLTAARMLYADHAPALS